MEMDPVSLTQVSTLFVTAPYEPFADIAFWALFSHHRSWSRRPWKYRYLAKMTKSMKCSARGIEESSPSRCHLGKFSSRWHPILSDSKGHARPANAGYVLILQQGKGNTESLTRNEASAYLFMHLTQLTSFTRLCVQFGHHPYSPFGVNQNTRLLGHLEWIKPAKAIVPDFHERLASWSISSVWVRSELLVWISRWTAYLVHHNPVFRR